MKDLANIKGGFDGELQFGKKPALLVIDFQKAFTEEGHSALYANCDKQIDATNLLIAEMRSKGPVFYTIIAYESHLRDGGLWVQKGKSLQQLIRDTPATQLDSRLDYDPTLDTILYKTQASAFFATPLAALLQRAHCDTLIVTGATTSGCVRASVVDAMQNGFVTFVATDAVGDRSEQQHQSNLIDMVSKYAEGLTTQQIIEKLN